MKRICSHCHAPIAKAHRWHTVHHKFLWFRWTTIEHHDCKQPHLNPYNIYMQTLEKPFMAEIPE